jgi:hypothetical protein
MITKVTNLGVSVVSRDFESWFMDLKKLVDINQLWYVYIMFCYAV